jgi:hypothetical protein
MHKSTRKLQKKVAARDALQRRHRQLRSTQDFGCSRRS